MSAREGGGGGECGSSAAAVQAFSLSGRILSCACMEYVRDDGTVVDADYIHDGMDDNLLDLLAIDPARVRPRLALAVVLAPLPPQLTWRYTLPILVLVENRYQGFETRLPEFVDDDSDSEEYISVRDRELLEADASPITRMGHYCPFFGGVIYAGDSDGEEY